VILTALNGRGGAWGLGNSLLHLWFRFDHYFIGELLDTGLLGGLDRPRSGYSIRGHILLFINMHNTIKHTFSMASKIVLVWRTGAVRRGLTALNTLWPTLALMELVKGPSFWFALKNTPKEKSKI
jgi:hypothetical protein